MPAFTFPNLLQVELVYGWAGEVCENVYHVLNTAAWTYDSITAMLNVFKGWEHDHGAANRNHNVELFKLVGTDLTSASSLRVEEPVTPPIPGLQTANSCPNNVTIAVKADTGERGRAHRGRTYWIGLSEDGVVDSYVAAAVGTAISTALADLLADVNAVTGCEMVVLSRVHSACTPIVAYNLVDYAADSQRRRLPLHNRHH